MNKYFVCLGLVILQSCGGDDFSATRIINGNTFQLSNGIVVRLQGVSDSESNIKILEQYLVGSVLLYDDNNHIIESFRSDNISAIVYNSDGDCINELLSSVSEITDDEVAEISGGGPVTDKTIVSFEHEGGVLKIPAEINGVPMFFIFDTGASLITISSTQARSLLSYGKLTRNDLLGRAQFSDANGDISEGMIINLSSVTLGNRVLTNVHACVLESQNAPLLFGQSALQKFGKVTIDYNTNQIVFE